jgi:hypothetical protein
MYQNNYIIPTIVAIVMLLCLSVWVPINLNAPSIYYGVDNFHGIRPRAIIGSLIYLLPLEQSNINFIGSYIKLIALFLWLLFITSYFYQAILGRSKNSINLSAIFIYLALAFIFASSSLTYITYSSAGFVDSFPAAIVAFLITSQYFTGNNKISIIKILLITGLLVVATWTHEKSIYDITILLVWFSLIWGIKKGALYFAPALLLSTALMVRMANKMTSGESPSGYLKILTSGLDFFWNNAFSVWGILIGGGALWGLYWIAGSQFIQSANSRKTRRYRALTIWLMLLICFLPLLVALDTSRLCSLIWLPVVLVLQNVNIPTLFQSTSRKIILVLLCIFQALIPPALIYNKGMAAFNCYGLWLGEFLPSTSTIKFSDLGPFGLTAHSRPDFTNFFIEKCASSHSK